MILAGDLGGTKTLLALFEEGERQARFQRSFSSAGYTSLEAMVETFLSEARAEGLTGRLTAACVGIAGPVLEQKSQLTNLSWGIDGAQLRQKLGIEKVWLLNDLEALGYSLDWLRPEQLVTLQEGKAREGNAVILAAGTGLGESTLFWSQGRRTPSASEGGHTDFAPRSEWEVELWRFLSNRYGGHVSYERIVSGQGFTDLYEQLLAQGWTASPEVVAQVEAARLAHRSPTPVISEAGLQGACPVCVEVVRRFVSIFGAEAGNAALKSLAVAGVYLAGGIPPRLLSALQEGTFMEAFLDKGRFRGLLSQLPVQVVLEPEAGLLGAAFFASHRL